VDYFQACLLSSQINNTDIPQRLKGAIDTRIAEEQARQRQAASSVATPRSQPRRRPQTQQDGSTLRVGSRQRTQEADPAEKSPDPTEFEQAFSIGGDDSNLPSRVGTPRPDGQAQDPTAAFPDNASTADTLVENNSKGTHETDTVATPQPRLPDLPQEIRVKLRKLERLESKYGDLLKAYRAAHARVQNIEPFEATLREHTPLTSIGDPGALVEYLTQITVKSDMVLEEFKKVSAERDDYKKKAEASEESETHLRSEVAELKKQAAVPGQTTTETAAGTYSTKEVTLPEAPPPTNVPSEEPASPSASLKSPASSSSRIASFSLFSPRTKPAVQAKDTSEDLFSYDSEVPRLEKELEQSHAQIEEMKTQMNKLKGDLTVARESTEGMVTSLEAATRELHELRDAKDKFEAQRNELTDKVKALEAAAETGGDSDEAHTQATAELREKSDSLSQKIDDLQKRLDQTVADKADLEAKHEESQALTRILNEKLHQKDSVVKDLEDSLAIAKVAVREHDVRSQEADASDKKLKTMQGVMDTLRLQLSSAEKTVGDLRKEIEANTKNFESRASSKVFGFLDQEASSAVGGLNTREDVIDYLASNFGLRRDANPPPSSTTVANSITASEPQSQSSKKKSKKKKKGKAGQASANDDNEQEGPVKVSEDLTTLEGPTSRQGQPNDMASVSALETEIIGLKEQITARDTSIEKLSKQIKDQEALQEEIETLRDDLLHQGEEHVEARDKLKKAEAERAALTEKFESLQVELRQLQLKLSEQATDSESHKKTMAELEDFRTKSITLQADLTAAEQLAASRFKELSELRDVITKAQPELKNLRAEIIELKQAKDSLKNKEGELKRLEARYEDLKSEMKGLSKRLGDKDSEIKELQQKIEQETSTRTRAEDDLKSAQSEITSLETRRQDAADRAKKNNADLKDSREESSKLKAQLNDLEERLSTHSRQVAELSEEVSLKTKLHSSSQQLVHSLRDQTHELNTQAREASTRAENLEEELAEAQRMLTERTREGQTMRMLLNQSETGTEARVREMKERMDAAIEERDRIEDEASVGNRRMMRELDDARSKAREAQRALKIVEDEKDEMDIKHRDSRRRLHDLEQAAERASKEVEEVRAAMNSLRDALNESERQVRDMEGQKTDLRKAGDDARERIEKLTKANKNLTEEVKSLQAGVKRPPRPGIDSGLQSSRTSMDSNPARSPAPASRDRERSSREPAINVGMSQGTVDYVYLKNVLLQFLEQKDKQHQQQLIPVLGMLLHFDKYVPNCRARPWQC
jgi:chromosome segregation ATPase